MRKALLATIALLALNGCSTRAAKDAVERAANLEVGKLAKDAFRNSRILVECAERDGQYGCLEVDLRDCRIWYAVNKETGRITGWRYAGPPEKCWTYHGARASPGSAEA